MGIGSGVCSKVTSLILGVSLLTVGCARDGADSSHAGSGEPPSDRVSTEGVSSPSGGSSDANDARSTVNLNCSQFIAEDEPPDESLHTVADVVALPAFDDFGKLAADASAPDASAKKYFAKQPLYIRANNSFDLRVSKKDRATVAIGWGNEPMKPASRIHVSCDRPTEEWMTFAGGYFADRQECAALIVKVDGDEREHELRVGIGTDC